MTPRAAYRAWHVKGPWRPCANSPRKPDPAICRGYRRRDGTATPLPRAGRVLPRWNEGQQRRADLLRLRRSHRLHPHPEAGGAAIRLAPPRPLPHGQPLPPARRDTRPQPLGRDARPQRPVRESLQRTPRPQAPRLRPAFLVEGDRVRGAVRLHSRVHRQQPAPSRLRPAAAGLALDVSTRGRSDRFAWCRTTPTS
jgi:hypothetical protein